MKTTILKLLIFSFLLSFFSCAPVTIKGDKSILKSHKKMALIEFVVAPHVKPIIPLIDAAFYNSSIDNIVSEIITYNISKANDFEKILGEKLNTYSGINVIYGDSLFNSEPYQNLSKNVNVFNLDYNDEDFTEIIIPKRSYNFFNFYETSHPFNYFSDEYSLKDKNNIKNICDKLAVDGVIIAITGIFPISRSGFFSAIWSRLNVFHIYFLDSKGDLILSALCNTVGTDGDSDDFNNYKFALDKFPNLSDFTLKVLFNLKENTQDNSDIFINSGLYKGPRNTGRIKK